MLDNQLSKSEEDVRSSREGRLTPLHGRAHRDVNNVVDKRGRRNRHLRRDLAGGGIEDVRLTGLFDPLAVDEVGDCSHERPLSQCQSTVSSLSFVKVAQWTELSKDGRCAARRP